MLENVSRCSASCPFSVNCTEIFHELVTFFTFFSFRSGICLLVWHWHDLRSGSVRGCGCIFHALLNIHLCLFQLVATKVSVKPSKYSLKSWWDFASHLQRLLSWREARLTAGTSIYNVSFTVNKLAELQWNASGDKQNLHCFLTATCTVKSTYGVKLVVCAGICWCSRLIEILLPACTWTPESSEVEGTCYAEQRKMLLSMSPHSFNHRWKNS